MCHHWKKKKKKSLLKTHRVKIKGWKTSSNLSQTLSQRKVQLMSSGSCRSLLAQEVKTNGYSSAPSLLASSHPHLIWGERLGLSPQVSVFSCFSLVLEWLFWAEEDSVGVWLIRSVCNIEQGTGQWRRQCRGSAVPPVLVLAIPVFYSQTSSGTGSWSIWPA